MGGKAGFIRSSLLHVLGNPSRILPCLPTAFPHPLHNNPEVTSLSSGTPHAEETIHGPILSLHSRPPQKTPPRPLGSKLFKQTI